MTDLLKYAAQNYGHLVKGRLSLQEWAYAIKQSYVMNQRNKLIYETINNMSGHITGNYSGVTLELNFDLN